MKGSNAPREELLSKVVAEIHFHDGRAQAKIERVTNQDREFKSAVLGANIANGAVTSIPRKEEGEALI